MAMVHHNVKDVDQMDHCIYCGKDLSSQSWKSDFTHGYHYKTTHCQCGHCIRLRIDLDGSGHDCWNGVESVDLIQLKQVMEKIKSPPPSRNAKMKTLDQRLVE